MTLKITVPPYCLNEIRWIVSVLFTEFLGVDYKVIEGAEEGFILEESGKTLQMSDDFFLRSNDTWLQPSTLPDLPLAKLDVAESRLNVALINEPLPIIYGRPEISILDNRVSLGLDIFGSSFFMLSRYEEMVVKKRDKHDRFPATASVAYAADFLERPIINEYVEVLWASLKYLWPALERKKRKFKNVITCDVDFPYDIAAMSLNKTILRVGARIMRDRNPRLATTDLLNFVASKFGDYRFDSYYNNLKWIMDVNEKHNNKVAFYFIPQVTSHKYDCDSHIASSRVRVLLTEIFHRGHEIGFHPGYLSYEDEDVFTASSDLFYKVLKEENICQSKIGGRQHYLRFEVSVTPKLWDQTNFNYDSTLSYADKTGFRSGICYEYTMYDLVNRKPLVIKQRPLIVMDASILSNKYEGLGYTTEALERFLYYKNIVKKYSGDFVLLWHNTSFIGSESKSIYLAVISQ